MSFKEIWCHETYRASGLPNKAPKLACVDPFNADIVYFFLGSFVFSVDLSSASLQKFARYKLKNPKRRYMSSRFVLPCETTVAVPPAAPAAVTATRALVQFYVGARFFVPERSSTTYHAFVQKWINL